MTRSTRNRMTDLQRDVVRRLLQGEHLTGPVSRGSHGRAFGFVEPGAPVGTFGPETYWIPTASVVHSLARRGVVKIDTDPRTARKTVRLTYPDRGTG